MSNFARIVNEIAVDVCTDPDTQFHPEIAAEFEPVPETVERGWRRVDNTWSAPEPEPISEPVVEYPIVSPVEFMLLFTSAERVEIKTARQRDPVLDDFFQLLEDPRLQTVRLGQPSVQDGLNYLASLNMITEQRKQEILQGNPV
jgi:hypothetical protein